jgi:hypothetical protein
MRFRQADWLHRLWVFAQLIVFSALAAFTKDFDITNGLSDNTADDKKLADLQAQLGNDLSQLAATQFREQRLPQLNAMGVSLVMAISRLLLLLQYSVSEYKKSDKHPAAKHLPDSRSFALTFTFSLLPRKRAKAKLAANPHGISSFLHNLLHGSLLCALDIEPRGLFALTSCVRYQAGVVVLSYPGGNR